MRDSLAIHLLGPRPRVLRGGRPQPPPRGHKAWALLAYLLTTTSVPSRSWLAELLFAEADDPLNALSWNLSQLRRLLGPDASITGEPVELRLPEGTIVDVHALSAGTWTQALDIPDLGRDLLEGMTFRGAAGFEAWLLASRRHLTGVAEDVLREAARAHLASGEGAAAVELATRVVAGNPFDEEAQELLIRAYAASGDLAAAAAQRDACVTLFRHELGIDPGIAVIEAADRQPATSRTGGEPPSSAATAAHLEAGLSALDAGAMDTGIGLLRQAVAAARDGDDETLLVRTLVALGASLVRSVRGRDGEGATILHEAILIAERIGSPELAAEAHRELGHIELLRGRYDRAHRWLQTAERLTGVDSLDRAWTCAYRGLVWSDVGRYAEAVAAFDEALTLAQLARPCQAEAWAWTFLGRLHLLRRDVDRARDCLTHGLETARTLRWTAFLPLPEALLADVDLLEGKTDAAEAAFEHAHALSLHLGDPCWEGHAARGLGLVAAQRGDTDAARRWLTTARDRCVRLPDAYLWVEGYCLDALCALGVEHWPDEVARWIDDLEALATRTGMRDLVARAYAHRSALGDQSAAHGARVLAAEVDDLGLDDLRGGAAA